MNRTLVTCLALGSIAAARPVSAQSLDTVLTVSTGSGMSLGGGPGVAKRRSPALLDVDVGLIFDGDRAMEWTPSLIMELEGSVSVGVNPSLKRMLYLGQRLNVYGGIGFPFFFAPFTLLGAEAAVGCTVRVWKRLGVAVEAHTDVFFAGSDLPDGSVLAKLDLLVGLRWDL